MAHIRTTLPLRRAALSGGLMALMLCGACGPSRLLARPDSLPARIGERQLWHTPACYVYARHRDTAGETERWVTEIDDHIRRTYDVPLGKGLVIIVDKGEQPLIPTFGEAVRLDDHTARACGDSPVHAADAADKRAELARQGMDEELYLSVATLALDESALRAAGIESLPPDAAWVICCPSQRQMESAVWEFAPAVLEKHMGKVAATATAWAWPLAFREAARGFCLGRDVLVFRLWAARRKPWSSEDRRRETIEFTRQRALILSPTLALAMEMKEKQAQNSSPPAGDATSAIEGPIEGPGAQVSPAPNTAPATTPATSQPATMPAE